MNNKPSTNQNPPEGALTDSQSQETVKKIDVPEIVTVNELSSLMKIESIELIKDLSLLIRSSLGEGLPGLGSFVIVPPVTYPKPRCSMDGRNFIFLSKPAASPIGFFNFRPARFVCRISSSK